MEVIICIVQINTVGHRQGSKDLFGKIEGLLYIQKVVCDGFNPSVYSDLLVVTLGTSVRKDSEAVSEFSQKVWRLINNVCQGHGIGDKKRQNTCHII